MFVLVFLLYERSKSDYPFMSIELTDRLTQQIRNPKEASINSKVSQYSKKIKAKAGLRNSLK